MNNNNHTYIIAEAGVNHDGLIENALRMIDVAARTGADAIKFQSFKTENYVTKTAIKAEYQIQTTGVGESQFEMIKALELTEDNQYQIKEYCDKKGIEFLSSPFDFWGIDFLDRMGLQKLKIPSGEINNLPYLEKIGALNKKIILSTGMSNMQEVAFALDLLTDVGTNKNNITILHCNTEYPTPMEDVNLKAMLSIRDELGVAVGYSDHTLGIEIPVAAVALGASVIEKHFTLDRTLPGPDHAASLEPDELKAMVKAIRNIEKALGDGVKNPSLSEINNISLIRKSIVAATDIKKGEIFTGKNLAVKRPGTGIPPTSWYELIGVKAQKDYKIDELISI